MNRLSALVGGSGPVLVDGGMGTLLQDNGLDDGGSGELWNVDRPEAVRSFHDAYARAGAGILTTNTFGGSRPRSRCTAWRTGCTSSTPRRPGSPGRWPTSTVSWSPATWAPRAS